MTLRGFGLVAIAALLTALANLLLRGGVLRYGEFSLSPSRTLGQLGSLATQPMFVLGVVLYGLAAIVWFGVLSVQDLSTSYPVLVGLTFVLVASGSTVLFQETLSWPKILGMVLILGGIFLIASI